MDIEIGDSVRTTKQLYFVDATNPETGEAIETYFHKWDRLIVCGIDHVEGTVDVQLPEGFVATLDMEYVEP